MEKQNVILIGPRCAGKTNTGKYLAELISEEFIDGDQALESNYNTSIAEMVKVNNWEYFRVAENETIKKIIDESESKKIVFAPGGGAVAHEYEDLREDNIKLLKKFGKIVLLLPTKKLNDSAKIIYSRINKDDKSSTQRPNLTGLSPFQEILETLKTRDKFYRKAADEIIYTEKLDEKQVAKLINSKL